MQKPRNADWLAVLLAAILIGLFLNRVAGEPAASSATAVPVPIYTLTPRPIPARTPDREAVYISQIRPWYQDVLAWSRDLDHEFKVESPDHADAIRRLRVRGTDLLAHLNTVSPPPRHLETHQHIAESMQSCIDAIDYYQQGDTDLSNIYGGVCTTGLTLMLDVIGR